MLPDQHSAPDVDQVIGVLDRDGPRSLAALREHPALAGWTRTRFERAIVDAWTSDRLSLDTDDLLVAL